MRTIIRAIADIKSSLQPFFRRPAHRMAKPRTPVDMDIPDSRPVWASSMAITEYIGTFAMIS